MGGDLWPHEMVPEKAVVVLPILASTVREWDRTGSASCRTRRASPSTDCDPYQAETEASPRRSKMGPLASKWHSPTFGHVAAVQWALTLAGIAGPGRLPAAIESYHLARDR